MQRAFLAGFAVLLAACTQTVIEEPSTPVTSPNRYASFQCGNSGQLVTENFVTSVIVIAPGQRGVELPASPPGSTTRYADGTHILNLNGDTATYSDNAQTLKCRRL